MISPSKITEKNHEIYFSGNNKVRLFHEPVKAYSTNNLDVLRVRLLGYVEREGNRQYIVEIRRGYFSRPVIREENPESLWLEKAHAKAYVAYRVAEFRAR